ncbi:MAG: FHA domain-containing protein [Clostridia bacterium]|nr:FHA domain-containing protein [Clostridia bacterium]
MKKYKICPVCKAENPPALLECRGCEADLTGVAITDEETEAAAKAQAAQKESAQPLVRLCACGAQNAPNARKCAVCGEDISDITPAPAPVPAPAEARAAGKTTYVLGSLDGEYAYEVEANETVVGREHAMCEYLRQRTYVSRVHAKLTLENGELFLENLSGTNFTYVNNEKITEKVKLHDGDEIGLGGREQNGARQELAAYFLLRIGQCT